jgi:hypothetical protein
LLAVGIFGSFIFVPVLVSRYTSFRRVDSACQLDGSFSLYHDVGYWEISGFFQITLPFGSLTFTQAKVIDIVWDVVSRHP